ncbi:MAG: protein kinase [Candidatus Obscuribacterales bacterium]
MPTDQPDIKLCPLCSKRVVDQDSASLTQWIFGMNSCRCRSPETAPPRPEPPPAMPGEARGQLTICRTCRKRISQPVAGSITQWIFASHVCHCDEPVPVAVPVLPEESASPDLSELAEEAPVPSGLLSLQDPEALSSWSLDKSRYVPLRLLGKGATGTVFLAFDRVLQRAVAVKCLHLLTSKQIIALQKEARTASRLSHRGIVRVLDLGVSENDTPYMVMDFIDGVSLKDLLENRGALDPGTVISIAIEICRALEYAHTAGIAHRDLKSSNVILRERESGRLEPVLIDLGLSRLENEMAEEELQKGTPGSDPLPGSAGYMAPDYIESRRYSVRAEIYSMGCLIFEMLTGSLPFEGDSLLETITMHRQSPVPSVAEQSPALDPIVRRCLAKDGAGRYQSARELELAIENLMLAPADTGDLKRHHEKSRLKPWPIIGAAAVLLAGAIFLIPAKREPVSEKQKTGQLPRKEVYQIGDMPVLPGSNESEGLDGYFADRRMLVIPDGRVLSTRLYKKYPGVDRLIVACTGLEERDLQTIASLSPGILELFRVPSLTPRALATMTARHKLQELHLYQCPLPDRQSLSGLGEASGIDTVSLVDCNLIDDDLPSIKTIKALKTLDLSLNPRLTLTGIARLRGASIERVYLFGSPPGTNHKGKESELEARLGIRPDFSLTDRLPAEGARIVEDKIPADTGDFLLILGRHYKKNDDNMLAAEFLEQALPYLPPERKVAALNSIASCFEQIYLFDRAIDYCTRAMDTFDNEHIKDPVKHYYLLAKRCRSRCYLVSGRNEAALKDINEVIAFCEARNITTDGMYKERVKVLGALQEYEKAILDLNRLIEQKGRKATSAHLFLTRAELLDHVGRSEAAEADRRTARELSEGL